MRRSAFTKHFQGIRALNLVVLMLIAMPFPPSHAEDFLGAYVGGAVGRADVEVDQIGVVPLGFDKQHLGWKLLFGGRPISVLGAEFDYINFGHPSTVIGNVNTDAQTRGAAVFALGYLPVPLPLLDVYGKVGLARLQTTATASLIYALGVACPPPGTSLLCGPQKLDRTDNHFAWGAGTQIKVSHIAVRAEYERFSTRVGNPDFLSVGMTWSF
jgi:opacity protein-like surface antigen